MIQTDFLWLTSGLKIKIMSPPKGSMLESPTGISSLSSSPSLTGGLEVKGASFTLQYSTTTATGSSWQSKKER